MDTAADTETDEETLPVPVPAQLPWSTHTIATSPHALMLELAVMLAGVLYCAALLVRIRATCVFASL